MIEIDEFTVWTISHIRDEPGLVRVTLKREGYSDLVFECPLTDAPAIGSTVVVSWR